MALGLFITSLVSFLGFLSIENHGIMYTLLYTRASLFVELALCIAQIFVVAYLSRTLYQARYQKVFALFLGYSALTGLTFSTLLCIFDITTIFSAFAAAAIMFACCAVIGMFSNYDFSRLRNILFSALLALVIVTFISMFIPVLQNNLLLSYAGIGIFSLFTCYDVQRMNNHHYVFPEELKDKMAIYSALTLYLDVINLFLNLLNIFSDSKN